MLTIRLEKPADIPAIRQLNFDAFGGPVEAEIVDRLRTDKALRYSLVGSVFDHGNDSEQIVAYLALSPVTITDSNKTYAGLGLGPVAVSPTMQNNGFGSQIIHYFFDQLAREDDQLVVLLGHAVTTPALVLPHLISMGFAGRWMQ